MFFAEVTSQPSPFKVQGTLKPRGRCLLDSLLACCGALNLYNGSEESREERRMAVLAIEMGKNKLVDP